MVHKLFLKTSCRGILLCSVTSDERWLCVLLILVKFLNNDGKSGRYINRNYIFIFGFNLRSKSTMKQLPELLLNFRNTPGVNEGIQDRI